LIKKSISLTGKGGRIMRRMRSIFDKWV